MDFNRIDPRWAWETYEPDAQQPWTMARAAHLCRRAGFAANWRELQDAVKLGPAATLAQLRGGGGDTKAFTAEVNQMAQSMLLTGNPERLSSWWLYRMLLTPEPLLEKMTFFWHGHFATSAAKVTDPRLMLAQNQLLRKHALGKFGDLTQDISRDPAMLLYLDSATNRKAHPNENYSRELMELFCLGLGAYSEKDIQEVARCFTGWEVRAGAFAFNQQQHDFGQKTALGETGEFDGRDAVRVVLKRPESAVFIARKLSRFFICDEPELPAAVVEPLAREFSEREMDIDWLTTRILSSRLFYSDFAIGRKIRSPVELGVGLLKALEGTTNFNQLASDLGALGQAVFFPPSVKGWDGGRAWINSATLLGRANLVGRLTQGGPTRFAGGGLDKLAAEHGLSSPEEMIDWLSRLLLAVPLSAPVREQLVIAGSQAGSDPGRRMTNIVHAMGALPEFHLC